MATQPAANKPAKKAARKNGTRAAADGTRKPGVRELAAQATREAILRAATKVFAKSGYDGGRIEAISKAAKSYDRMIYYYFGSKEGLFVAVLEDTYRRFNEAEQALELDASKPLAALTTVIRFVWGYYQKNPEFITLLNTENLHRGRHLAKSPRAREYSSPVIAITDGVLRSGQQQGLFRSGLAARDVYLMIAAMAYFYLSNRHTLSSFLGENLEAPAALAHWEGFVIEAVQRAVRA
ncbi:MAG: TetR family transcriptional regulator [Burkholderiaceae bacterium]|nr:TetR family transcriptional regulator [Burkholderiaceae bacterium]